MDRPGALSELARSVKPDEVRALHSRSPDAFSEPGVVLPPVARGGRAAGPARVAVVTLGCKVNQFDSAALVGRLQREGLEPVAFSGDADIFVVNTCSVTVRADQEARQWIRRARRLNPEGTVIVTGCYAASGRATLEAMPEVDLVADVQERERIYELLRDRGFLEGDRLACQAAADPFLDVEAATFGGRTRAVLKVQDGCNAFCTFCIIPYTRGRSRSLPPERVVRQVQCLAEQGFREVVLTGINLSTYGRDLKPRTDLRSLLEQIEAQGVPERLRLSSVEPTGFTDGLIALLSRSRLLCPHQHIPLQSGDDAVLRRMNRRYTGAAYAALVHRLHDAVPDLAVGTDVIVGFPGEDEAAFQRTYELLETLPLAYLHVFPFSARGGTRAARFPERVEEGGIRRRSAALRALGQKKRRRFASRFLGQPLQVLAEEVVDGRLKGYSRNYIPVLFEGARLLLGREVPVVLQGLDEEGRGRGAII